MAASQTPSNSIRITGSTVEQLITNKPAIILAVIPDNTTAGNVTVRDGAAADGSGTPISVSVAGLTQQGKTFGPYGVRTGLGLTVQLSQAADAVLVVWMPQL